MNEVPIINSRQRRNWPNGQTPTLVLFFVKTDMGRKQIVATKAIIMFASHMMKIIYFGIPMLGAKTLNTLPPWWFFLAVIPFILLGTFTGTRILHRLGDDGFKSMTKYLGSGPINFTFSARLPSVYPGRRKTEGRAITFKGLQRTR